MQIILNENTGNIKNYFPFSATHLIWEIRCGALRLFEKIANYFPNCNIYYETADDFRLNAFLSRELLQNTSAQEKSILEFFTPILIDEKISKTMLEAIKLNKDYVLYFHSSKRKYATYFPDISTRKQNSHTKYKEIEIDNVKFINYLWDVLDYQTTEIKNDLPFLKNLSQVSDNLFVGKDTKISDNVVLDTNQGYIIIDDEAQIMHNSTILAPCYIGKNTNIKIGAKIYENCSFGENCKIGGELENTIFHNYSNKQHDGFLGHSYIGEWVNIGAGTNNSDLKNNYSKISVQLYDKTIHTDRLFLGLMCGDHTKISINSTIATGSVFGAFSMFAQSGFSPKFLPEFSWLANHKIEKYDFEKAIKTVEIILARRNKKLTDEEKKLYLSLYEKII